MMASGFSAPSSLILAVSFRLFQVKNRDGVLAAITGEALAHVICHGDSVDAHGIWDFADDRAFLGIDNHDSGAA